MANFDPKLKIAANYSCDHSKRPQEDQNSDGDGSESHFEDIEVILGNFGVILGPFRDHSGSFLTLNSNLLQTSHVIIQNDRKWSRMQMMMVSRLNFKMFKSFWGLEWHQMTPK